MSDLSSPRATAPLAFSFDTFSIRVIERNGEPWFVAGDACAALGIDPTQVRKLDDDEKSQVIDSSTLYSIQGGGNQCLSPQAMNVVNESGLYTLILRCRDATKPGTLPHRFRKWVTSEVLPAIRKTERYQTDPFDALYTPLPPPPNPITEEVRAVIDQRAQALVHPLIEETRRQMTAAARAYAKAHPDEDLLAYVEIADLPAPAQVRRYQFPADLARPPLGMKTINAYALLNQTPSPLEDLLRALKADGHDVDGPMIQFATLALLVRSNTAALDEIRERCGRETITALLWQDGMAARLWGITRF